MNTLIFLCLTTLSLYPYNTASQASGNVTAGQTRALLSFKDMVSDPLGSLLSWNSSNDHPCRWRGVGCGRKHGDRIVELNLNSFGLIGGISPSIGNLSYLRVLNLGSNQLVGQIPTDLGHLRRLRVLNISMNSLEGGIPASLAGCTQLMKLTLAHNHLQGEIPSQLGTLTNLVFLSLMGNGLSGNIPASLGNLSSLAILSLSKNSLSGAIPASLGNLSRLTDILVWRNQLSGAIPSSLGRLPSLVNLDLEENNLTGSIPPALWNVSSMVVFAVDTNDLTGTLPPDAFSKLPLLEDFNFGENSFHGEIPSSLGNATSLVYFQIPTNSFSGTVPPKLGGLQRLQAFVMYGNAFQAKNTQEWEFMQALTNATQLQVLQLELNKFSGTIPSTVSNLSTTLSQLSLGDNKISGHIPGDIGNLVGLEILGLDSNYLTGPLPSSISMLRNVANLRLQNNSLSGSIPPTLLVNLTQVEYFDISMNAFSGIIPSTIGDMVSLLALDLSTNNFTGTIPSSLFNITTLSIYFSISNNHFQGPIPPEVGNLKNLVEFDAMFNQLSGEIPSTLGNCQLLRIINLKNNSFTGNIPSLLSGLKGLDTLDLSSNNFSGKIPAFLGELSTLSYLNLSFNNFDGEVPRIGAFSNATRISVQGNSKLCGGIQDLHLAPCSLQISKRKHKIPVLAIVLSLVATTVCVLSLLIFFLVTHKRKSRESPSTMSIQGLKLVSYQQLAHATNGFSASNLLGSGNYGSVYRANLYDEIGEEENIVAVKVLKLQTPGALKSFTSECEAMRNLRHRNLVKIITACSSIDFNGNDFKAIVLDFMPNGSLEEWLHPSTNNQSEKRHLGLTQRISILFDVAYALDYLHCNGTGPVVHCDLKPSNVLLDSDMVAHVGDFGIARILVEGCSYFQHSTNSMGFRGTIGYAPPEYGAGNMVSTHGDIYSYGILVLEMITGKRPTDNMFDQGLSLRKSVEIAFEHSALDIVDVELTKELENGPATVDDPTNQRKITSMISLLKLGIFCTEDMPSSRISTKDIIKELHAVKC
uniref:Uncharacterized protein n=1 Tax=Avena sativa TaxID=4498 RepID=A0ACD5WI68_AVESA